jgi:hypothetical protein
MLRHSLAVGSLAVGSVLLLSCGGGSAYQRSSSSSSGGGGSYGYAESGGADADYAAADYAAPVESPRRDTRPGLGTSWGETVHSEVRDTPFSRASSSPFASLAIYYNDADGVRAQADYRGGGAIYARTPHGGIVVSLVDIYGNPLPGVEAGGKTLVVGQDGERYNLHIANHTGGRYEVVATVDGLDVIDGHAGDLRKRGYILNPHDTLVIDGFRRSETAVAAFRFGAVSDSYAARTSGDRNVGVIGMAFFAESGSPWTTDELQRRDAATPFPGDRSYALPPY